MKFKPNKQQLLGLLPNTLVLTRGPRDGDAIYLSFDDGPHPEHTPRLLDLLAMHDAHASFFLVGKQVERHPALVERIVAAGHALGNHSYSHPPGFNKISLRQQLQEIDRTDHLLAQFDHRPQHRFRPPRGSVSLSLLLHFARRRRNIAYWSYNSMDYQHPADADMAARLRKQPPRAGDIVLMHDDNACAGRVLSLLLPEWRASGRSLLALPSEAA
ncbi:polysaccharide deacetylase family protein [Rhodanobacter sp. C03]|uniref:polysaccharide deacetylase family protein n=1 Tax=Rhodanobacter sp. C03 TaxID=1945858 RepID=UPI0009844DDA|nr:polysaccharide deacetylase family protein [Rhodanobacter sp. C03]OOG53672.1 polysaccharide deacetylase [Rhodanobacter sp. C03]